MQSPNRPIADDHRTCRSLTGLTFAHLPPDERLGRPLRVRKGADLWRPDDPSDRVYFLRSGRVAVLYADAAGNEIILQTVEASRAFGELCFCAPDHSLRQTTARATATAEVVEIQYDQFVAYLQRDGEALHAMLLTFCARLGEAERRAEILMYRGAKERLGRLLLQLAEARGHAHKTVPGAAVLHVSHDELARTAAMSRAHVTVTMGKLRGLGLVSYDRNRPLVVHMRLLSAHLSAS